MTKSKSLLVAFVCSALLFIASISFVGCNPVTVTSIEIDASTVQTTIKKGSTFTTNDIVVKATKSDKSVAEIDHAELTFSTIDTSTAGTKTLTVTYAVAGGEDLTDTVDIKVYGDLTSISVKPNSYADEVEIDGTFDSSSMVILAGYEGDVTLEKTTGFTISTIDTSTLGEKTATVSFTEGTVTKTCNITITVVAELAISAIEIDESTVETLVKKNSTFSTDDIVVKLVKSNNSTIEIDNSFVTFSTIDTSTVGTKTLTVTYTTAGGQDFTDTVDIKVYGDLTSISVKAGTYAAELDAGSTFDSSNMVILAEYEGNVAMEKTTGFTVGDFDNNIAGAKTVTISFTEDSITKTCDITITVINNTIVVSIKDPLSISAGYNQNSIKQNTFTDSESDGVKGFEVTGNMYVVGSTNPFIYNPIFTVMLTGQSKPTDTTDINIAAVISLFNGTDYEALTGSALTQYVDFDGEEHAFQFTTLAEGKQFKIEVYAANMEYEAAKTASLVSDFEFKVINGYNIYDAAGLSAIDNANVGGKWTEYKAAHNIDLNIPTTSFILHNNITIERDDLPAVHYWTQAEVAGAVDEQYVVGSLKDGGDALVYKRMLGSGDDFVLEGNYFTISAQNIPLIYRELDQSARPDPDKAITTHTALFGISTANENMEKYSDIEAKVTDGTYATIEEAEDALVETAKINNIGLTGNSNKSEDALLSGGIILVKVAGAKSDFYNNLTQRWCISYFVEGPVYLTYEEGEDQSYLDITLNKTNLYDGYNTLIYNWGNTVKIKESHLIGAGGPVMICDHVRRGRPDEYIAHTYVDKASVLESYVAGSEGWFATYTAANDLFAGIKAQNAFFNKTVAGSDARVAKSITRTDSKGIEKINLIAAFKDGGAEDATSTPIKCSFEVEGDDVNMSLNEGDSYLKFVDLVVLSRMLDTQTPISADAGAPTIAQAARQALDGIKQAMVALGLATNAASITDYQAYTKLKDTTFVSKLGNESLTQANGLVLTMLNDDTTRAQIQQATSKGIIYYGKDGMICMPGEGGKWAIEPNADLYNAHTGYTYMSVFGSIGAVVTLDNVQQTN